MASQPAQRTARSLGHTAPRRQGLSIVELLCVLAITLVLVGGAVPLANDLRLGQRLHATAALLETDIQFARSESVRLNRPVRLVVQATATGGSCYMLHAGAADACRCADNGRPQCEPGTQLLRSETQSASNGVVLDAMAHTVLFEGRKGTVTPTATLRVKARDGRTIHQVVNVMGRVRSCAPAGAVGGIPACA